MKWIFLAAVSFSFAGLGSFAASGESHPVRKSLKPKVVHTQGRWSANGKQSKSVQLPLEIKTESGSELQLSFGSIQILVHGGSTLSVLEPVDEQTGAPELTFALSKGDFVLQNPDAKKVFIQSPVAEGETTVLAAFFRYQQPEFTVLVEKGQFTLRGIGSEESVEILAGQKAFVRAAVENNQIVFDELLAGKKVIRAETSQPSQLSSSELHEIQPRAFVSKAKAKAIVPQDPASTFICRRPLGKFNDCAWSCEKRTLTRRRCNAGGLWSEAFVVSKNCEPRTPARVEVCDY